MRLSTRSAFILAVALGSFALIGGTGLTVSSAWLITMASQHPPILILGVSIVMVRFFGIFRSVARYGERVISHEAIFRKLTGIRVELFSAFATQLKGGSGSIAGRSKAIVDDVERAQEFHLRITLPGISAAVAGAVTIVLAFWITPVLLPFVIAVSTIFALFIPLCVRTFLDPIAVAIEERENHLAIEIAASSHAMVEAEIYGYGESYRKSLTLAVYELRNLERRFFSLTSALALLVIATIGASLVGVSALLHKRDDLLPIQVSMAIFLILVGFEGFTTWFPNLFPAGKIRRASQSIKELSDEVPQQQEPRKSPQDSNLIADKCEAYWGEPFLQPISFTLSAGETLLITGPSGVGKSTLAGALLGFAQYSGSLTIGGVEIGEIENLHRYISASLQNSHIFNTTLRENLKIAREGAIDQELKALLSALELDYISLDEVLGEFGRALSGGEGKRLAVARALLSDAPIVILDEPLEHLDHERALHVQSAISSLARAKSLIVITHSPWLQYSRKLVLARE